MFTLPFLPAAGTAPATPATLTLRPGAVCSVRLLRGQRLLVQAGRVWLTTAGDPRDHLLDAGQAHVATCRQTVVIEAVLVAARVHRVPAQGA